MKEKIESTLEKKEFGHNIHIEVDFDRHFAPKKDPDSGASLDALALKGHREKRKAGKNLPDNMKIKEYASEMKRAQQSAMEINSIDDENKDAQIINQALTAKLKEKLVGRGYDKSKLDRRSFKFLARIKKELNPLKWNKKYKLKCLLKNPEEPNKEKWQKKSYDEVVQYWLDNPDNSGETTNALESAAAFAHRINTCSRMANRLYDNSNVLLKHKTHGPNPDALLKEIIIQENGKKGFDNVQEIDGAIKPGEGIKFIIDIDADGNKTTKLKFRDKVYDYDKERFNELVEIYKEKKQEK